MLYLNKERESKGGYPLNTSYTGQLPKAVVSQYFINVCISRHYLNSDGYFCILTVCRKAIGIRYNSYAHNSEVWEDTQVCTIVMFVSI